MPKELSKPTITKAQAMKLCEEIRAGMGSIAEKLYELHKGTGWVLLGYITWKDCCEKEFRHSAWWAKNQLRIAEVRKALPPPPPKQGIDSGGMSQHSTPQTNHLSDRAVAELAKVPEPERQAVLEAATTGEKPPTAAAIRQAAAEDDTEVVEMTPDEFCDDHNKTIESFCRKIVKMAEECPELFWLEDKGRRKGFVQKVKDGCTTLRSAKCVVCPKCDGGGCKVCSAQGVMPKMMAEALA